MLHPHELQIGSIVEYKGMACSITSIMQPRPDKSKRFNNVWIVDTSLDIICPLSELSPIFITENILIDWCVFEWKNNGLRFGDWCIRQFGVDFAIFMSNESHNFRIDLLYLHELQLLFLAHKTSLPIQIK